MTFHFLGLNCIAAKMIRYNEIVLNYNHSSTLLSGVTRYHRIVYVTPHACVVRTG